MAFDEMIHELRTSIGVPNEALRAGVPEFESLRPRIVALPQKLIGGVWRKGEDGHRVLRWSRAAGA